jgi:hypothetical protein
MIRIINRKPCNIEYKLLDSINSYKLGRRIVISTLIDLYARRRRSRYQYFIKIIYRDNGECTGRGYDICNSRISDT